jgi:hypothetical protein
MVPAGTDHRPYHRTDRRPTTAPTPAPVPVRYRYRPPVSVSVSVCRCRCRYTITDSCGERSTCPVRKINPNKPNLAKSSCRDTMADCLPVRVDHPEHTRWVLNFITSAPQIRSLTRQKVRPAASAPPRAQRRPTPIRHRAPLPLLWPAVARQRRGTACPVLAAAGPTTTHCRRD